MNDMDLVNDLLVFFRVGYSIVCGCLGLLLFILAACIILRVVNRFIEGKEE